MAQRLHAITLVIRDYDEAIEYYIKTLGFQLIEDTQLSKDKRWVVVAPSSDSGARLLLAKAANQQQLASIGNQTGGRVFLFLHTDDFDRDFAKFRANGVQFVEGPRVEPYGKVAVFTDLYGNKWDLVQRTS